jgi:type I restriction enzyme S subunit
LKNGAQQQISEFQYGQTKPGLSLAQVRAMRLPLPPLALQSEFAKRVAEIRALESAQAASRQRLEALFHSLLHRAFNGEY